MGSTKEYFNGNANNGSVRQPTALGDGIYAFEKIMDAEKFRPDHEVIIITLKDTETILNLDDWQVLYELADTLMSTGYEDVFEKRFYSEETQKQYRKLFKLFAEFIIDVANGEKQLMIMHMFSRLHFGFWM
ncbi:hypothetical protein [Lacticaseibacillus manihotivorans]|uniref:hypothetical protein n=1 Tax=Lacticaseibacillus manihotivorans TaxID=88233 RepID=UPI001FB243FC|nr:hypothetical protein [Lacticaseibacillus manihotivorans]